MLLGGYTDQSLDGQPWAGLSDPFLMKYDADGTKQWTRQFGTSVIDVAYGLALDDADNAYLAGRTQGALGGQTLAGAFDLFVAHVCPP